MQATAIEQPGAITPGSLHQDFFKPEKEEPRGRMRVRVKLKNRNCANLQIFSRLLGPGEHVIECYDDEAIKLTGMVEDPELMRAAQRQFEIDFAAEVMKGVEHWNGSVADIQELMKSGADERVNASYKRVLETTPLSPQATFTRLNKRGMKPLDYVQIIAGSERPEPQRAASQKETERQADAIAAALDRVLSKHFGGGAQAMTAEQVKALVSDQIEAQLGGKAPGKR